jgi:hypothetical protein
MELLNNIEFWHWWALAAFFIVLEMFDGNGHFIWLGVSAAIVGLLSWAVGMSWQVEFFLFEIFSVGSIFAWGAYRKANPQPVDYPKLNKRGANYIDRTLTLSEPIVDGVGKVKVDDTIWKVRGPDLEAGSKVKVTAVDGTSFIVKAL